MRGIACSPSAARSASASVRSLRAARAGAQFGLASAIARSSSASRSISARVATSTENARKIIVPPAGPQLGELAIDLLAGRGAIVEPLGQIAPGVDGRLPQLERGFDLGPQRDRLRIQPQGRQLALVARRFRPPVAGTARRLRPAAGRSWRIAARHRPASRRDRQPGPAVAVLPQLATTWARRGPAFRRANARAATADLLLDFGGVGSAAATRFAGRVIIGRAQALGFDVGGNSFISPSKLVDRRFAGGRS